MGEDLSGRILLSTEQGGIYSFAKGKLDEILYHGAPILDADTFYTDADGLVWIGTIGNGLLLLDHGKVSLYSMRDGLYDNEIFGIVSDSQDRLWFTCIKGLYSVNRGDLRRFAAGELKNFVSTPYTSMDSLNTIEGRSGSQPAILRTRDGSLWFSANRGLVSFDPNRHQRESPIPPVVIEQVIVNGQISDPRTLAELPPGEKNLDFRYTGINFTLPARMTFRYKLEGYDKDWIDAGSRREAYYTKLPPGKFHFLVTACTAEGICNTDGARVDFRLAYRYYERSWFLPGCLSLIAFAAWLLYKLRVRQLRERFSLVLAERSRIARELHDTLIHGLSGLTMQVQALAERTRFADDKNALEEIIRDAAACMQETRQSVVGLRSARQSRSVLATAIATAAKQITKETDVRLKLELDVETRSLPPEVEYNLLCIAREAISNSVRHSGARTIEVLLAWVDHQLQLIIKDDGHGFDCEHGADRPDGHYGLIGMKERAALIGADFDLKSRAGQGTAIFVFLPPVRLEWELSHHVKEETTR
jgi:signal transduction histidine kinase